MNNHIKQILRNNSTELAKYLGLLLRKDYKDRIKNNCRCLNTIEKDHLINYIYGRYRDKFLRK